MLDRARVEGGWGEVKSAVPGGVQVGVAPNTTLIQSMLFVALAAGPGHVEVEHQEFRLLGSVTRADRAYEFGRGRLDAPDYASGAAR